MSKAKEIKLVDPDKILTTHQLRGRKIKPSKDEVKQMAASIEAVGQESPVKVRPLSKDDEEWDEGYEFISVFGSTRVEAVRLLKSEDRKPNRVEVEIVNLDQEQSFELTIRENNDRKETTPIDDSHNQQLLRERFGKTDAEIAKIYGMSSARVSQLKKLTEASVKLQSAVARGLVSAEAAIQIVQSGASAEQQEKVLDDAKQRFGSEKLSRSQVKTSMAMLKEIPDLASSNGSASEPSGGTSGPKARTSKQIFNDFYEDTLEGASADDATWKDFAKALCMYVEGKRTYKWLYQQACKFREEPIVDESVESDELPVDEI